MNTANARTAVLAYNIQFCWTRNYPRSDERLGNSMDTAVPDGALNEIETDESELEEEPAVPYLHGGVPANKLVATASGQEGRRSVARSAKRLLKASKKQVDGDEEGRASKKRRTAAPALDVWEGNYAPKLNKVRKSYSLSQFARAPLATWGVDYGHEKRNKFYGEI
jgi:hypothetical protein